MRGIAITAALSLLAGGLIAGPPGSPAAAEEHAAPTGTRADFNGDGADDLAIGIPFQSLGAARYAGVVTVLYGSTSKLSGSRSQLVTQVGSPPEADDFFGAAVAAGDFNRDGFADLAVGAPNEDAFSTPDAGAVSVLYGSSSGLTGAGGQIFTQAQAGDAPESFDRFGSALAVADFNHDGYADLAADAQDETVGGSESAGAVSILYGSAAKLTNSGGRTFTQVGSAPEPADRFGSALATGDFNRDGFADLAAAAPGEGVYSTPAAGAVSILYGSAGGVTRTGGQLFTQVGSAPEPGDGFGAALAAGDFNNDGFADLAASAPFEGAFSTPNAGVVSILYGSTAKLTTGGAQIIQQVGSRAEAGDDFGTALATGDFNGDGFADLAAGAPAEDSYATRDTGAVSVLYGSAAKLSTAGGQIFTQVGSGPEAGDYFGAPLTAGDFSHDGYADLAAAAVFEDAYGILDAGAVSVLYGTGTKLTSGGGQIFTEDTPGVPGTSAPNEYFGEALAS
jgi:FG-GAP repeat